MMRGVRLPELELAQICLTDQFTSHFFSVTTLRLMVGFDAFAYLHEYHRCTATTLTAVEEIGTDLQRDSANGTSTWTCTSAHTSVSIQYSLTPAALSSTVRGT